MASVDLDTPQKRQPPPRPLSPSASSLSPTSPIAEHPHHDHDQAHVGDVRAADGASPSALLVYVSEHDVNEASSPPDQGQGEAQTAHQATTAIGGDGVTSALQASEDEARAASVEERRRLSVVLAKTDEALDAASVADTAAGGGSEVAPVFLESEPDPGFLDGSEEAVREESSM
jgi:hypothetical protein